MTRNPIYESAAVVVASSDALGVVRWYADMLTGRRNARICTVRLPSRPGATTPAAVYEGDLACGAVRQQTKAAQIGLLVSEFFPNTRSMQDMLGLAHELRVPAVFVRHDFTRPIHRVVVTTGGGPHVLQQLWTARETARAFGIPVHFLKLRSTQSSRSSSCDSDDSIDTINKAAVQMLGMRVGIEVRHAESVGKGILTRLREDDLLVMGAPSPLRVSADYAGSLPDIVARKCTTPLILLSTPPSDQVKLRSLFWGRLIRTGMRARNKGEAIAGLIDNLVHHNQLPHSGKADMLDRIMRRERVMSTAVDCETAFPHVMIRGFFGVAGSLGIFPEGVAFDGDDNRRTKFVYLLITPDGMCDEYLAVLAKIARRMVNPDVRNALLGCSTSSQAMDVLEPREERAFLSQETARTRKPGPRTHRRARKSPKGGQR